MENFTFTMQLCVQKEVDGMANSFGSDQTVPAGAPDMDLHYRCNYSRLSLSRLRLSRITAYLEEKNLVLVLA